MSTATHIIEDTANRFWAVAEIGDPDLAHCWEGYAVKRVKGGFARKAGARKTLVSKAHVLRVVEG